MKRIFGLGIGVLFVVVIMLALAPAARALEIKEEAKKVALMNEQGGSFASILQRVGLSIQKDVGDYGLAAYFHGQESRGYDAYRLLRIKDYRIDSIDASFSVKLFKHSSDYNELVVLEYSLIEDFCYDYYEYSAGPVDLLKIRVRVMLTQERLGWDRSKLLAVFAESRKQHGGLVINDGFIDDIEVVMQKGREESRSLIDIQEIRIMICPLVVNGQDIRDENFKEMIERDRGEPYKPFGRYELREQLPKQK